MNKFKEEITKILSDVSEEPRAEAEFLIEMMSNQTKTEIILGEEIKNQDKIRELALLRAETKKPIQYIVGFAFFMGEKFKVSEDVLIPRDETELLVRETVKIAKDIKEPINMLEIGIGSGCVSCMVSTLLSDIKVQILGVDISTSAIQMALENIPLHAESNRIIVRKSDVFSAIREQEKFDIIFSNPPYIPYEEKLQKEVMLEPQIALFAPDNGLYFYKKIINEAKNFLKKDGYLVFEMGINEAAIIQNELIKNDFQNIEMIKDMQGIERVIKAQIK